MNFTPATLIDPKTKQRVAVRSEQDAQRYFGMGYQLETTSPTQQPKQPPIRRAGAGFETLAKSPLQSFQSQNKFMDIVKQTIQRKQREQKPLTEQKAYWRTMQKDAINLPIDEKFRQLSPEQQRSLHLSRENVASAHLQGIREEEEYRGTRVDDIIKSLSGLYEARYKDEQLARGIAKDKKADERYATTDARAAEMHQITKEENLLNMLIKKRDNNMSLTDEDYKKIDSTAVGNRIGGTVSWRHNNPGNLKFAEWQREYGATKKQGSAFAVFPDEQSAYRAYKALLLSKNGVYAGLSQDEAMLKWSSDYKGDLRAYNYQKLVGLGAPAISKPLYEFTDKEWFQLFEAQKRAEGWTEGTIMMSKEEQKIQEASELTGYSAEELSVLDETALDALIKANKEGVEDIASSSVKSEERSLIYKKVFATIDELKPKMEWYEMKGILVRMYGEYLSDGDIKAAMQEKKIKQPEIFL